MKVKEDEQNMRKFSMLITILLLGLLLGGCMSIGLTDGGSLEISEDGIKVIKGDEPAKDDSGASGEVDKGGNHVPNPVEASEEDADGAVLGEGAEDPEEEEFLTDEGFGGCQNEFYLLQNRIVEGFPLTPCPEFKMIEVNKSGNQRDVLAIYDVNVDLYSEYNQYLDFFEENGYTLRNDHLKVQVGIMEASDQNMQMNLALTAVEKDLYYGATVEMTYRESPARDHPIVDSIVNQDDTSSFGKCDDEYYVLKDNVIAGFPFDECVGISFLSIVFDGDIPNVNAVYTTSGTIDDLTEKYADFFSEHGNIYETNYEGTDDSDAVTIAQVDGYEMSIKYVTMANGKVGIQLFYEIL